MTLVGEDGVVLATGRDPDGLLDTLALLRPTTQPSLLPGAHDEGELIAILGAVEPNGLQAMLRTWAGGHAHAVLLDVDAWNPPGSAPAPRPGNPWAARPRTAVGTPAQILTEAGWTVLLGDPGRRPDDVWDEFCRRLPLQLRART